MSLTVTCTNQDSRIMLTQLHSNEPFDA